eukprot:scaffold26193_cov153-Skeletonema_marinoi.AAC.3
MSLFFATLAVPRAAFAILSLCLIIAFDSLLSFNLHRSVHRYARENRSGFLVDGSLTNVERAILLGRHPLGNDGGRIGGDDYDLNYITAQQKHAKGAENPTITDGATYHSLIDSKLPLPPYNVKDVVASTVVYNEALALLIYNPADDEFLLSYSRRHPWSAENEALLESFKGVSYLLRTLFPQRFQGMKSKEFSVALSAGTFPHVKTTDCVKQAFEVGVEKQPCVESHFTRSPILHFGNVFSSEHMYPNIIPMPKPGKQLGCFQHWTETKTVCDELQHLVYNDGVLNWDELSPEVMWRGEDYGYMANVPPGEKPSYSALRSKLHQDIPVWEKDNDVPLAFQEECSTLLSRWRGVLLTIESFADSEQTWKGLKGNRPAPASWCNIRFNRYTKKSLGYKAWEELKMPVVGDRIPQKELTKYRYHIDLGSDVSSSYGNKLQQLAKPGLLFHHVSPTKDFIHDHMKPRVHYIPVAPQLNDLKAKFDWAESHSVEAKNIADRGTELARYSTSSDGFERMFQEDIVEPLRQIIEAYQPSTLPGSQRWRKAINEVYADSILPLMKCSGRSTADCERVEGKEAFASTELRRENCQIIYMPVLRVLATMVSYPLSRP